MSYSYNIPCEKTTRLWLYQSVERWIGEPGVEFLVVRTVRYRAVIYFSSQYSHLKITLSIEATPAHGVVKSKSEQLVRFLASEG